MENETLTIRLTRAESRAIEQLRLRTGLSNSTIVKKALKTLAGVPSESSEDVGLYQLGAGRFGAFGDVRRQATAIKRIAHSRARARRISR